MKNIFCVDSVYINQNNVICNYRIEGEWEQFFTIERQFWITYSEDISNVPESVAVLPLICNVLPVAWIMDATVKVPCIDADFYSHVEDIKDGYKNMYPQIEFNGRLIAGQVIDMKTKQAGGSDTAVFFSGGVDAYTTMLRFYKSFPYIMTIWGADVKLTDEVGWERVWSHSLTVAETYGIEAISIKSNFRSLFNEERLSKYVLPRTGDGWWHGFQHGIGIIGHAAPLSYALGLSNVCIASSNPAFMNGKYTCASDPTIDEKVHFAGCKVVHDGCDLDRQGKVQYIIETKRKLHKPVELRVCWESSGGSNCCACEKCYRTILELVSEGENPNEYGFKWDSKHIEQCKRQMKYKISLQPFMIEQYYPIIQERMVHNKDKIQNYDAYDWLIKMNFDKFNNPVKVIRNKINKTKLASFIWKLFFEKNV